MKRILVSFELSGSPGYDPKPLFRELMTLETLASLQVGTVLRNGGQAYKVERRDLELLGGEIQEARILVLVL